MTRRFTSATLELVDVKQKGERDGGHDLQLTTSGGEIRARYHGCPSGLAVLWVFGTGGGLGGPAGGVYERLGSRLAQQRHAASLQVDYRRAGQLEPCVLDVLLAIDYLRSMDHSRIILVGHSFGGAVVIRAGVRSADVVGVAALSSQTSGVDDPDKISPRPLFLAHGQSDEILPWSCSATIFYKAAEPKTLKLYPGCKHGLDDCREELDGDLMEWFAQFRSASR